MLNDAVAIIEYMIRSEAETARGASAAERSQRLSKIRDLVSQIDDPVFRRDAIRIASRSIRRRIRDRSAIERAVTFKRFNVSRTPKIREV